MKTHNKSLAAAMASHLPGQREAGASERRVEIVARSRPIAAARAVIGDFVRELRRLNALGSESPQFASGTRRIRARIIRERLTMSYRSHPPCC